MSTHRVGVIMNGITGRMGRNQHLVRSILAIREQGGVRVGDDTILPEPLLVGRNRERVRRIAEETGCREWTTDLNEALSRPDYPVYFDAVSTQARPAAVRQALAAGKHVYCEKPTAPTLQEALDLYHRAREAGVKHGVVQDKLWLPGIRKLRNLLRSGFFGRILAVRGEFGYWVFDGEVVPCQRPSWNYRREDGGGIVVDMFPHWRYLLDHLFGGVEAVQCTTATLIPERIDERGSRYRCTADDAAYAMFRLANGAVAIFNSSWSVRVRRDDLLTIQVDGTRGSAVAGLRECWIQPLEATPKAVWNPDLPSTHDYRDDWSRVPDVEVYDNAFKVQWELFLRHVVFDDPFPWDLLEGAKGVQLAEKGAESAARGCWVEVPPLA